MNNSNAFSNKLQKDLQAQADQLAAMPAPFRPELQQVLNNIQKIDFRKQAEEYGLAPDEKLTQKVVLVVAIRELLKQVDCQNAGLVYSNGLPYFYTAGYWHELPADETKAFLTAAAIALGMKQNEAQHFESQDNLCKQFIATARLLQPHRQQDKVLINFTNGTLEIEKGKLLLRPARKADFLKYQLPYGYDPGASCPLFNKYLNRVLPDTDAQAVLAEFVGNALAPGLNLQKALVLLGPGSNGKSVFCEIITALFGRDNVSSYTMESLTKQDSRSRPHLENKLLNYSSENSLKLNIEAFKTLVRNEPIEGRHLYGESFTMEHYARLMFNCNQLPRDIEQSEGFFRSFLIIPFKVKITDAEKDPQLAAKIIASELPGVFNWVLAGLQRLLKNKRYTDCEAARQELDTYRRESSSVLMYIDEAGLVPSTDYKKKETLQTLFCAYNVYCDFNGERFRVNQRTFAKTLREAGFTSIRESAGTSFYCEYAPTCERQQ